MIYLYACGMLCGLGGILAALLQVADRFLADYGPCRVAVNGREPYVVEGGCTLLEALFRSKVFIPSACGGQGTCGFCKVTLKSGGGPVLPTELPYLGEDEIRADVRLACRVKVRQDISLLVRPDYLDVQEFRAVVSSARMVTHDTRELVLRLVKPEEITFEPGQYVQVRVPSRDQPSFRAYSISSPPSRNSEIELVVRLIPGGIGSTYLHRVRAGDELEFTGPYGEFRIDAAPGAAIVCVGGGCGIAPMRSIVRHVHETAPGKECLLFFGARTVDDVMYMDEFRALACDMPNFRFHYALSEPKRAQPWEGETGLIHESLEGRLPAGGECQVFMCGPPAMIEATTRVLTERGVPEDRIFRDEF